MLYKVVLAILHVMFDLKLFPFHNFVYSVAIGMGSGVFFVDWWKHFLSEKFEK